MNLKRKNRISAEFSMASMTDIIFLLLVFFMITSSAISHSAIEVKLPKASDANPNVQDPTNVVVNEEGKFFINDNEIPKQEIENAIKNSLKQNQSQAFTIKADENTKHKDIVFLMNIAEKNGLSIAIATTEEE